MQNNKTSSRVFGETRETGEKQVIDGIRCDVLKKHFPVDSGSHGRDKWAWYTAYRFTVPGWPECTITGLSAARRVIRGRTDPAVNNTLRINPNAITDDPALGKTQAEDGIIQQPVSVLDAIREFRHTPRPHRTGDNKQKSRDFGLDE